MGCGTSKSEGVIPAKTEGKKSLKQKKSTNGGTHQKENKNPKEIPSRREVPPPISFEISAKATDEDSIIKKHPPKRLQIDNLKGLKKLEDHNVITNRQILEKQMSAKERRSQHLQERVQSSRLSSRRNMSRSAMPATKLEPTIPETAAI